MVTTVSPTPGDVEVAAGPLQLRVHGTRHDGRLVELNAQKCAVGASRQATLRLASPALEPIEVLIVRGQHSTVAKAWSPTARLNGRRFDTATIGPGDRLAIGPLELEVVACPPPAGLPESPPAPPRFTELIPARAPRPSNAALPRSGSDRQRSRRLLAALRAARQEMESALASATAAGAESQRLHEMLQSGQREVERLRTEAQQDAVRDASTLEEQEELALARAELAAKRIELNTAREELERRTAELLHRETEAAGALANRKTEISAREQSLGLAQAELDRLQMEAAELRQQMEAERKLVAERQTELEERSEALDRHDEQARQRGQELDRRQEDVERAAAQQRTLEEQRQQVGDEQAAFEAQRLAWESQRGEQHARIAEEQQRLQDEAERLEHVRRTLETERADWEQAREQVEAAPIAFERQMVAAEADEPAVNRAETEPAADEDDAVFARLRAMSLLKDRDDQEQDDEPAPQEPAPRATSSARASAAALWAQTPAEEEESDDYVPAQATQAPSRAEAPASHGEEDHEESIQDYMNRLLQRVRGDAPAPAAKPAAQAPARSPTTYRPAPAPAVQQKPAADAAVPAAPRKTLAPERSSDLLAMRELANLSAQTALDSYAHRRWASAAIGKVIVSVFALVACLTLMAALPGWSTLKIISGGAALVIAVFWGLQAGILAQQVRAARRRNVRPGAPRETRAAETRASADNSADPDAPVFTLGTDASEQA
jgi:hypothetical protein